MLLRIPIFQNMIIAERVVAVHGNVPFLIGLEDPLDIYGLYANNI